MRGASLHDLQEGSRLIREQRTHKVRLPTIIKDGQKVRIRDLGGPGKHGGAPRDMYISVHVIN
jgi:DnaJ-class molecular chaperone